MEANNMHENCVFCKIVNGEIPSIKVYEDQKVLAFLDISPASKGHCLVVTKEHFDNFLTCPPDLLAYVFQIAQKIGQAMVVSLHADGINILTNVNKIAGQSVFHFHVHIIPRYKEDKLGIPFEPTAIEKFNLPTLANQIKEKL